MATIQQVIAGLEAELVSAEHSTETARTEIEQILGSARSDNRNTLSAEESKRVDDLFTRIESDKKMIRSLTVQLENAREVEAEDREVEAKQNERIPFAPSPGNGKSHERSVSDTRTLYGASVNETPRFVRTDDGKNAVLGREQRFADYDIVKAEVERNSLRDKAVMDTHGDLGQLVRSISTTSGASALVPTMWAADVIDLARNNAVCFQAGASLVPMAGKSVQVARLTQDPAPVFRDEGATIPASDPAFDYITLTATSLGTIVVCSLELLQDSPNAGQVVESALAKAMALEIDKAALFGQLGATGTNDEGADYELDDPYPVGVLKTLVDYNSGSQIVGDFPTDGTAQTAARPWLEVVDSIYKVARGNEKPGALVSNTALVQQYDSMYDSEYNPIRKPDIVSSRPWLQSNVIPSFTRGSMTNRATDLFVGDWSQLLIGQRLGLQIRVLSERYAELGQVGLLAFWRGDVAVARPEAFAAYRALQGAA